MVRKKRPAPAPPTLIDTRPALPSPIPTQTKLCEEPFFLFNQSNDEDERCVSNSSPSQDSGVPSDSESNLTSNRDEKSRSRDSSVSKRYYHLVEITGFYSHMLVIQKFCEINTIKETEN